MTSPPEPGLRSVAEQTEEERGGAGSILSRQSAEHSGFAGSMRAYDAEPDPDARGRIVADLTERALRHAFAEETVLFPAYRKHLGHHGDQLTATIESEHQEINEALKALQRADPSAADYDRTVRETFALIRDDARQEEDVLLPMLQQAVDAEQLRVLGAAWEAARLASPTRPHPTVSRRPPWNALAALGLAVSDRVKDAADHLAPPGTQRRMATSWVLAAAVALGGVALVRSAVRAALASR